MQKTTLIGNVGKYPEIRTFDSGSKVASFPVATSEKRKDKEGNFVESVEWHNIKIFGKLAEVVEKYVKKGDKLYLEGKNKTEVYEKDGKNNYFFSVVCFQMEMLGSKKENSTSQNQTAMQKVQNAAVPPSDSGNNEDDSDLPF